ncbi:FUSC family protein [Shewanella gaetbuli]
MFDYKLKNAIKVAITVSISLFLALWFQWDKPYWAAITAIVLCANGVYGQALRQGRNRVLGTLGGVAYALFLVSFFSQSMTLFILFLLLFLSVCVYFASDTEYGYAFNIAAVVCAIVSAIGGFDGETTFHLLTMRIQETALGVVVYSVVFGLVWPVTTEQAFFEVVDNTFEAFETSISKVFKALENNNAYSIEWDTLNQRAAITQMNDLLAMPHSGSANLQHQAKYWQLVVSSFTLLQQQVDELKQKLQADSASDEQGINYHQDISPILETLAALKMAINAPKQEQAASKAKLLLLCESIKPEPIVERSTIRNMKFKRVFRMLAIISTCFAMWIYLPIPSHGMFPMLATIFACVLVNLPDNMAKHGLWGVMIWGPIFIAQYTLIMPHFTELWQLLSLYAVNIVIIWTLFSNARMGIQRILGGNLMMVLTMNALKPAPVFDVSLSLNMLAWVIVCIGVVQIYTQFFNQVFAEK